MIRQKPTFSRFIHFPFSPVLSLAPSNSLKYIAVGYESGDIEIWNVEHWCIIRRFPSVGISARIIIWAEPKDLDESVYTYSCRLFSLGSGSRIIEWNFKLLKPLRESPTYGGNSICAVINPLSTLIAVGCDDGALRIFSLIDSSTNEFALYFLKRISSSNGKILSLFWSINTVIATGHSDGSIRLWKINDETHSELLFINIDGSPKIHSLLYFKDFFGSYNIAAGDSFGRLSFYETKFGTQISGLKLAQKQEACIISLTYNNNNLTFYAGTGYGPSQISNVAAIQNTKTRTINYLVTSTKYYHERDVNCVVWIPNPNESKEKEKKKNEISLKKNSNTIIPLNKNSNTIIPSGVLISSGNDSRLSIIQTAKNTVDGYINNSRYYFPPFYQNIFSSITDNIFSKNYNYYLLLVHYKNILQLWKLNLNLNLNLGGKPDLKLLLDNNLDFSLLCSSISNDGNWFAYSNTKECCIYKINTSESNTNDVRIFPEIHYESCTSMTFSIQYGRTRSQTQPVLIIATLSCSIIIIDLNNGSILDKIVIPSGGKFNTNPYSYKMKLVRSIISIAYSSINHSIVIADSHSFILIYSFYEIDRNVKNKKTREKWRLLDQLIPPIINLKIHPLSTTWNNILIVLAGSNNLYIYDMNSYNTVDWSRNLTQSPLLKGQKITGFCSDLTDMYKIYLYSSNVILLFDGQIQNQKKTNSVCPSGLQLLHRNDSHSIVFIEYLRKEKDFLFVSELMWSRVTSDLPKVYPRKKFGQ